MSRPKRKPCDLEALAAHGWTREAYEAKGQPRPPHYGPDITMVGDIWIRWLDWRWRAYIYKRDGMICQWCDKRLYLRHQVPGRMPTQNEWHRNPDRPSEDHLRPVSRGGSHTPFNLITSCGGCNDIRRNVDWRVFAQYLGREALMRQRVECAQWKTYQYMLAGSEAAIFSWYALELYRDGQHPVFGAAIDPHPGILPDFTFYDSGFWGVPVVPNAVGTILGKLVYARRRAGIMPRYGVLGATRSQ